MTALVLIRDALDSQHDAVRVVATAVVTFSLASTVALCAIDAVKHRRRS